MATRECLFNLFEDFGFELSEEVIDKCLDLSITHNIDPREFVEIFVAFSVNHLNGAEPTLSSLDDFERKELANYKNKPNETSKLQNFNDFDEIGDDDDDTDDVMEAYICTTPNTKKKKTQLANVNTPTRNISANASFNAATESPLSVTSKDVKGKVVVTFGNSALFKAIDWKNSEKQHITIERFIDTISNNSNNSTTLTHDQDYMFDTMQTKSAIAADRVFDVGQEICLKLMNDHPEDNVNLINNLTHVGIPNQTTIKCVGRICSDSDYKLDSHSTLLIGADEMKLRTTRLNFNRLKSYSVFPGQTVFVQGLNPRGDTLFVDEIYSDRTLSHADAPNLTEDLSFVIACGPFTVADELNYEPMNELLAYCKENKPDVLILIGPFLDVENRKVQDCSMKTSYETYFENLISNIYEAVGQDMEILIVSSSTDVHSSAIYPTHPYSSKMQQKNLVFLPDPCILNVNGVTIAMTATDIYNHILDTEIAINAGDKIKRIANYLFNQRSFYPLNPPSDKVNLDSGLTQQFASLPIVPNMLILPSSSRYYARDINNCLVVNPGKLVEGSSSGTFSRVKITANSDTKSLSNFVGCQIIKI